VGADQTRMPAGAQNSYLVAMVVSGFDPLDVPGIDLSREPGMAAALARVMRTRGVAATELVPRRGLFLIAPASNLIRGMLRPGYVVVFVPVQTLLGGMTGVRVANGDAPGRAFTAAGRRFAVAVPPPSVDGPAALLPWIVLGGGLALAAFTAALSANTARRARTQAQLDRIFTLAGDLMAVMSFEGRFTRVNPAAERILGYSEAELLARPYLDFVHPDDRERTAREGEALARGKRTTAFENRFVRADGTERVLEWTATPVPEERMIYSAARDVTERRRAEAEARRLTDEQIALLRVAVAPPAELFGAIAQEIAVMLDTREIRILRADEDGTATVVGRWGELDALRVGERVATDGVAASVLAGGRTAREDAAPFSIGAPILVDGRVWGAIITAAPDGPPGPETEARLGQFTALVATAIANAESRAEVDRLAVEQAALRRVATLVAEESPPAEVFAKVAEEAAAVLGEADCALVRDEGDGTATVVGLQGGGAAELEVGRRFAMRGGSATMVAIREARPVRIDDYAGQPAGTLGARCGVACPIIVRGSVWGAIGVVRYGHARPFGADAERRLTQFADLVATAIANADARGGVERLAAEQAALRRVATLVAEGVPPAAVFDAVAAELEALLGSDGLVLGRFEPGEEFTVVAHRGLNVAQAPPGTRMAYEPDGVIAHVRADRAPVRLQELAASSPMVRDYGVRASVGAPVVVDGRLWGLAIANWREPRPPIDAEERLAQFAQLLDTAIANADSRDQLKASRARLLEAGDEARRRVVRDLHDGAQQRLVHTIITLKLAQRALAADGSEPARLVDEALEMAERGSDELRELAHGILPAILTTRGLAGAVDAFVERLDLPVGMDITSERFAAEIEASAYFIVAESLTNVVKHARAQRAEVTIAARDGALRVAVRDDGIGGADPAGPGLVGLSDRASALGGRLDVESAAGGGTVVIATFPLE
jgi:PAS domain S-box-containing protein